MELPRLRYFLAAADELSFRRAAVSMGVGQPVISRQIAALEDELGVTLFERRSTGVHLTEVGRSFYIDVRRIVSDVERARDAVQSVALGTTGKLRLAVCEDATTPIFAAIIAAHHQSRPEVVLDLFEIPSTEQPAALRRGDINAGLLIPPVHEDGIQLNELWREKWLVAMPNGHRWADKEIVTITDLAGEDFITGHPECGCHAQSQAMFITAGLRPRVVTRACHRLTMAMLVRSGAGVTLVPSAFANASFDGIVTRPLSSSEHWMRVAVAYPEGDMQGVVAQFLRIANAAVADFRTEGN